MQNPYNHRRGRQRPHPATADHVVFRIVCHVSAVGGVIGNAGSVVSRIRRDTSCRIHCEEPPRGSDHRVILIVGAGAVERRFWLGQGKECDVSCAQEAMIRVFERLWEVEAERESAGGGVAACEGEDDEEAYCGLVADTTQIGAVVGRGGKNIVRMRAESGAKIRILPPPSCARRGDELIQITGATLAVKKALVAVSGCLQDCPPLDKDPRSLTRPVDRTSQMSSADPHAEIFPHLSALLPPMPTNSINNASNSQLSSTNRDLNLDTNGIQKEVSFKLLCSNSAAGAIIGKKGAIVRALQNQTGASIMFAPPVIESGERVVTISASENLESLYSPAQNAVVLVFARSVESDIEKGLSSGLGSIFTARLLVPLEQVRCLSSNGGGLLTDMVEVIGADVQVLEDDLTLDPAPKHVVIQVSGEYENVQKALFQITGRLRDNLLPPEVLSDVSARSPYGKAGENTPPGLRQSASLSTDSDKETVATQGMDHEISNGIGISPTSKQQLQQTAGREHRLAIRDGGSITAGGNLDLEGSLDYLLPREVLNEVGGRNPYKGEAKTIISGLQKSSGLPPDADRDNILTKIDQLGFSDSKGRSLSNFQSLQTVERDQKTAYVNGRGGVELESGKKSAVVKNTTVEIVVAKDVFGSIYGRNGSNLAYLRQVSGAKVEVHDPHPGEGEGTVVISGTPNETQTAQHLLQAFIMAGQ